MSLSLSQYQQAILQQLGIVVWTSPEQSDVEPESTQLAQPKAQNPLKQLRAALGQSDESSKAVKAPVAPTNEETQAKPEPLVEPDWLDDLRNTAHRLCGAHLEVTMHSGADVVLNEKQLLIPQIADTQHGALKRKIWRLLSSAVAS